MQKSANNNTKPVRAPLRDVDGIFLLDKPSGISSALALTKVRGIFRANKGGHTGTLDPLASGLLPICLGQAAKFSSYFFEGAKKYVATGKLGITTTTCDAEGEVVETKDYKGCIDKLESTVKNFLGEMGGNFAFMGNQYHLKVGEKDFYIDLLLYHRLLKSLVAIELKIGEFNPEFVGQLQFYLTALDKQVKVDGENSSIGIIICKEKDRTVVEYALSNSDKPIGVATYKIHDSLPEQMKDLLPSPEEIKRRIENLDLN